MLDRNQISPVEQLSDGHSRSPKLSTKTPLTKVSNLESLCEEETTGDVFDSEAERVRVGTLFGSSFLYTIGSKYRRSGNFRVIKFSCLNFRVKIFSWSRIPTKIF